MTFEAGVFLLTKAKAEPLRTMAEAPPQAQPAPTRDPLAGPQPEPDLANAVPPAEPPAPAGQRTRLRLAGTVPPEVWNHLGTRILSKLRSGEDLNVGVAFSVSVDAALADNLETELRRVVTDLGLGEQVRVEPS